MGIPIGRQYTATMSASMHKPSKCESCNEEFVYEVHRKATGQGSSMLFLDNHGASNRAESAAQRNLEKALEKAVDIVACPHCGFFQKKMVSIAKGKRLAWTGGIALVIALVLAIVGLIDNDRKPMESPYMTAAIATAVGGCALAVLWFFAHNPNRGHEEKGGKRPEIAKASRAIPMEEFERLHSRDPDELQAELYDSLRTAMLMMAAADGTVDDSEIESVIDIYEKVTEQKLDASALRAEAEDLKGRGAVMTEKLAELEPFLENDGKAMFIRAVLYVAAADGEVDDTEWETLALVGEALAMTVPQIKIVIASMSE